VERIEASLVQLPLLNSGLPTCMIKVLVVTVPDRVYVIIIMLPASRKLRFRAYVCYTAICTYMVLRGPHKLKLVIELFVHCTARNVDYC
jgi:hypothetical protein